MKTLFTLVTLSIHARTAKEAGSPNPASMFIPGKRKLIKERINDHPI